MLQSIFQHTQFAYRCGARMVCNKTLPLFLVLTLAFLIVFTSADAEKGKVDSCKVCGSRGVVTCKVHGEDWVKPPYKSSALIEHKCGCCGLGWMPCPRKKCPKREEGIKKFKEATAPLFFWLKQRRATVEGKIFAKYPKLKDLKAAHAETDHYYLAGTFRDRIVKYKYKGMVKKKKYDSGASLHLYAERIEAIYQEVMKMIRYEGDYRPRYTDKWLLMIWDKEKQQEAASYETCHFTNSAGAKIDGVLYTTWDSDDDMYLHHKMAAAVTNLVVDDYGGVVEYFPDWIREATAHWIEYKIFSELRIFSGAEGGYDPNCPTTKLKSSLKKAVIRKDRKITPFSEIMNKKISKITGWERLKCWSIIDWMVNSFEEDKLGKLIDSFKRLYAIDKQQGPSFKEVFDMTPDEIDEAWAAWVLETYPNVEDD